VTDIPPPPGDDPTVRYLATAIEVIRTIDPAKVNEIVAGLTKVRSNGGRLFILGVGGGAGHASHAVNDFRKLCNIESYTPTDNVSELTARINDDGWDTSLVRWLEVSRLGSADALMVFSVGGGSREHGVSVNVVNAVEFARQAGTAIFAVVGSPGGAAAQCADVAVVIQPPPDLRTPIVESLQALVWHAFVSHPQLAVSVGHWESLTERANPGCV
jgi:D-sedoheptulose 7-phosphate isomerase